MENCNRKPPKKPPFPAMSAHFAHTLNDMAEQYIQAQYIELGSQTGILEPEDLQKLVESRSNLIVYEDRIFRFSRKEDKFLKYICLYVDGFERDFHSQQVVIEEESGEWIITDLVSEDKEQIDNLENAVNTLQDEIDSLTMNGGEIE